MKRLFILCIVCLGCVLAAAADAPVSIDIAYASKTNLDISLYSLEEPFVNTFPDMQFAISQDNASAGKTVHITLGCIEIHQFKTNGKAYDIYMATVKGKLTVTLAGNNGIVYSRDLEAVSEAGINPAAAEIRALTLMKEVMTGVVEREKKTIAVRLK